MNLFDDIIAATKEKLQAGDHRRFDIGPGGPAWPAAATPELVMEKDAGVELGHPDAGSCALVLWTADASLVEPNRLTLAGPDLHESGAKRLPFVKIVLLLVSGFDENNCHARHQEMSLRQHRLLLTGYMVRAAALYHAEWGRVDRFILSKQYGFAGMGRALGRLYSDHRDVQAVELVVSTSLSPGPSQFAPLARQAGERIAAMNRMVDEMTFDCSDCEYTDVCKDVAALRKMRTALNKRHSGSKETGHAG